MAAWVASAAFLPLLIINLAVFQPQGVRIASLGEGLFIGAIILMMTPFTFICFLTGAAVIGPISFWGLKWTRASNAVTAVALAGISSVIAARIMLGVDASNGDVEIATSVAISGAAGGLIFHRRMNQRS
jgi:hypothetical protein